MRIAGKYGGRQISGGAKGNARHSAKPPIAA
ncbi:hypothetical protein M675_08935, partial [Neisseria gonorrhoeae SK1902]